MKSGSIRADGGGAASSPCAVVVAASASPAEAAKSGRFPLSGGTLTKVIAACCGLAAFAIAVTAGLAADNPVEVVLVRALASMVLCQLLGVALGTVVERVVGESIESHKRLRTAPQSPGAAFRIPSTGASAS